MVSLAINNLIKIILGVFVIVVVIGGIYFFFKNYVLDFIKNLGGNETNLFLYLLK